MICKKYDYELLARWLANYRRDKELSQSELADIIGVSREIISAFENGRTKNMVVFLFIQQQLGDAITGFITKG